MGCDFGEAVAVVEGALDAAVSGAEGVVGEASVCSSVVDGVALTPVPPESTVHAGSATTRATMTNTGGARRSILRR